MLDISPILLLGSALVFLLVLARLNSCLYKPLFKHMNDRDLQIKTDLENSRGNAAEVEGMLEEANNIIAQGKNEAFSIRAKAKAEAIDLAETKFSEAKVMMDSKYEQFIKTLADERVVLEKSLVSRLPLFKDGLKAKLSSI